MIQEKIKGSYYRVFLNREEKVVLFIFLKK
jgi:hypothetical protein